MAHDPTGYIAPDKSIKYGNTIRLMQIRLTQWLCELSVGLSLHSGLLPTDWKSLIRVVRIHVIILYGRKSFSF